MQYKVEALPMPDVRFEMSEASSNYGDEGLIERILAAYGHANRTLLGSTQSMWLEGALLDMRRDIHEVLKSGDVESATTILRNPGTTNLHHGFEDLSSTFLNERLPSLDRSRFAMGEYAGLLELGRAVGVLRVRHHDQPEPVLPDMEKLLGQLDSCFGFRVTFPNPFPDEPGVVTTRGISSYRAPPALYQAWRIWQLVGRLPSPRVLEIGGGLGRTAFYARAFGIMDYTIVDLPITGEAQANFLGRVLPPKQLQLYREAQTAKTGIKLIPPAEFFGSSGRYDLIINVDSMTEMAPETAQAYCQAIAKRATTFLSINHEGLSFSVADLLSNGMFQRAPYWMRPGYVEELAGWYPSSESRTTPRSLPWPLRLRP